MAAWLNDYVAALGMFALSTAHLKPTIMIFIMHLCSVINATHDIDMAVLSICDTVVFYQKG